MTWTKARVGRLTDLWQAGQSYTQIAAELSITRGAVSGHVRRLGLQRGSMVPNRRYAKPPVAKVALLKEVAKAPPASPPSPPATAPDPLRIPLLELHPFHCRWPIGDPRNADFGFCGHAKVGRSYCEFHQSVAFVPLPKRRQAA